MKGYKIKDIVSGKFLGKSGKLTKTGHTWRTLSHCFMFLDNRKQINGELCPEILLNQLQIVRVEIIEKETEAIDISDHFYFHVRDNRQHGLQRTGTPIPEGF